MFKRIFTLIITIFFICFKCLTWVPMAAATGIPAFDAFYYAILQSLGMAYTNGVEMDLAPVIAEVRENVPDYLQQPDVALKYLLRDYASKAWDNLLIQWNDSADEDVTTANIAAIRIASNEVSTPTLSDIVKQYQKKALDTDYQITTPINTRAIAFWNHYDSSFINQYQNTMNYVEGAINVNPDINYQSYIDTINGDSSFYWKNYPSSSSFGSGYDQIALIYPFSNYSWIAISNISNLNSVYFNPVQGSQGTWAMPVSIIDINIISGIDNTYSYSVSIPNIGNVAKAVWNGTLYQAIEFNTSDMTNFSNMPWEGLGLFTFSTYTANYSGNLALVLAHISQRFRNINLFVDGVPWAIANIPQSTWKVDIPNSVIDNSNEDGKIISNPIYWTVDENNGTPIDAQINLDKLIDYLKGVIDGSNSDTSVDYGDLVNAGVIEKQDGTAITDANVIAVPVADAIDDAYVDNPAISEPIVAIEDLPPLPDLPPFFPTPDFPEGDPTSGFHGMSVLARIINITNQSLPSDIVLVFYGVVFGAVILGLIKILHK